MKGTANLATLQSDHEAWKIEAKDSWAAMQGVDQRRVKAAQKKLEDAMAEAAAAEVRVATRRAASAQHDPETGEIVEAA